MTGIYTHYSRLGAFRKGRRRLMSYIMVKMKRRPMSSFYA